MDKIKARMGPTDVDGLAYDYPRQKYCEICDLAPITINDRCENCGELLKEIKR